MKLQHIAVLFILIILPIFITLSTYIDTNMKTIRAQTKYTTSLMNATHDAALSFQINTANNGYSTIADSKTRDVEASISTFYNILSTALRSDGFTIKELQLYTPAILCTLYDGYYIYTKYQDEYYDPDTDALTTNAKDEDGNVSATHYTYGLKPYMSYSCRYKGTDNDFIVNYTLDNTITIIGKVNGADVTKTGHLIALPDRSSISGIYDLTTGNNKNDIDNYINSKIQNFTSEDLWENLVILRDDGLYEKSGTNHSKLYQYVIYKSQKFYVEDPDDPDSKWFWYGSDYRKNYVSSADMILELKTLKSNNNAALKYYEEAVVFSNWVNDKMATITQSDAVEKNGSTAIFEGSNLKDGYSDLGDDPIFQTSSDNDPLVSWSTFNEHRMNVIRYSITQNLSNVLQNFGNSIGVDFRMPNISEQEWYNIENNVTFVSFMQGMPLKGKTYNNYCVVSNNTNKECVNTDSIYIIAKIDGAEEYHKPGCKHLAEKYGSANIIGAYAAGEFKRKSISVNGEDLNAMVQNNGGGIEDAGRAFFYPQSPYTACYDCIVNAADLNSVDDILTETGSYASGKAANGLVPIYRRALARERYNLYTINGYLGAGN